MIKNTLVHDSISVHRVVIGGRLVKNSVIVSRKHKRFVFHKRCHEKSMFYITFVKPPNAGDTNSRHHCSYVSCLLIEQHFYWKKSNIHSFPTNFFSKLELHKSKHFSSIATSLEIISPRFFNSIVCLILYK